MSDGTISPTALNLGDIAARVDGLRIGGNIVGLALVQVANDPSTPMVVSGNVANSLFRRSFLPALVATGLSAEDFGMPENCMPGADFTGLTAIRLTAARSILPGANFGGATTPNVNMQKADLRNVLAAGWKAVGAFFEESNLTGMTVDPNTVFHGAHFQDAKRGTVEFGAANILNADFGPESTSGTGQPRRAARIDAAARIHATTELGQ